MKNIVPILAGVALLPIAATATSTSNVVGYVSLADTVNLSAVAAFSEATLSVPLNNPTEWTGLVDSVAGDVITVQGALTPGAYDAPASGPPYLLEVSSGTDNGMWLPILSNTDTTITIMPSGADDASNLVNGDVVGVHLAWTLGTFLPQPSIPDGAVLSAYDVGQDGINNSANPTFVMAAGFGGWLDGGTFLPANDTVLYPGESFVLVNNTATPIASLVIAGEVPTSNSRIRLFKDGAGSQDTRFSYVTPVTEILDDAGFVPVDGDVIIYYDNTAVGINKQPSTVIYASGFGGWLDGGTFLPVGATFELKGGEGYVYRRDAAGTAGDVVISDEQSYRANL